MGYFAETMALFEFKGDAEAAYATRNAMEKFSGDHQIGRTSYAAGKAAVHSNDSVRNSKEYARHLAGSKEDKRMSDAISSDKDMRDHTKSEFKRAYKSGQYKELQANVDKYQNGGSHKGIKESFSGAFASVEV